MEYEYSEHARDMLKERGIQESWVKFVLDNPEEEDRKDDGTVHYIRRIEEAGGRFLRVVTNSETHPPQIVTAFFDRRLRRRKP